MILEKQANHSSIRERLADAKRKSINKSRKEIDIATNDLVVYKNHNVNDICNGLKSPYFGPFLVEKIFENGRHCQIRNTVTDKVLMAHLIHLRPFNPQSIDIPLPPGNQAIGLLPQRRDDTNPINIPASFTRSKDPTKPTNVQDGKERTSALDNESTSEVCKENPTEACKEKCEKVNIEQPSIEGQERGEKVTKISNKRRRRGKRQSLIYDPHPVKRRQKKRESNFMEIGYIYGLIVEPPEETIEGYVTDSP